MKDTRPKYFYCCGCDHFHPLGWVGDCRDNAHRFTAMDLDAKHPAKRGSLDLGWAEVDEDTGEES